MDLEAGTLRRYCFEHSPSTRFTMIEFILPDMTCGHCVKSVTATVQAVDTNAVLQIDLPQHQVRIQSDKAAEAFRKALAEEGYPPAV
jgi:copper chaperone